MLARESLLKILLLLNFVELLELFVGPYFVLLCYLVHLGHVKNTFSILVGCRLNPLLASLEFLFPEPLLTLKAFPSQPLEERFLMLILELPLQTLALLHAFLRAVEILEVEFVIRFFELSRVDFSLLAIFLHFCDLGHVDEVVKSLLSCFAPLLIKFMIFNVLLHHFKKLDASFLVLGLASFHFLLVSLHFFLKFLLFFQKISLFLLG